MSDFLVGLALIYIGAMVLVLLSVPFFPVMFNVFIVMMLALAAGVAFVAIGFGIMIMLENI